MPPMEPPVVESHRVRRRFAAGSPVWLCLLWLWCMVHPASALEVQQVEWGFDGRVVPGRFNVVSVLVANPSTEPFDGAVSFSKSRGMGSRVGAASTAPCYLSALTKRWLQFYVFIDNQYDQWRLEWGGGPHEQQDLDPPPWGPPAQVLLYDPDALTAGNSPVKEFPDELFPPTVAAAAALQTVLLDHVPRWEPAKRQAFLDWLRAGGRVHLLLGADGRYPAFADELSVLNSSEQKQRVGAGLVVRQAATAHDLPKEDLPNSVAPPKTPPSFPMDQTSDWFFRALAPFSQQHYNWAAIYLLAIIYMVLVGPGNLRAAAKLADYRLRLGVLLATVAVFAFLFNLVGRRGAGESSAVHSLSYARCIDGDSYDVMQWVNVFAVRGAHYTLTHAAPHNLYSTGQDYEAVNGRIENGKGGRFLVDIPRYSRRAFLHAAEMKGPAVSLTVVTWSGGAALKKLVLTAGPDFTKQILDGWVVQGDQLYPMHLVQGRLEFDASGRQSVEGIEAQPALGLPAQMYQPPGASQPTVNVTAEFRKLALPLLAWSRGGQLVKHPDPDGSIQLFLFARSPEGFGLAGSGLGPETGFVLYQFTVFKPGTDGKI